MFSFGKTQISSVIHRNKVCIFKQQHWHVIVDVNEHEGCGYSGIGPDYC